MADHVHHDAAEAWLSAGSERFATCPITQGSLVRLLVRQGVDAAAAHEMLRALDDHPRHEFWPDDIPYQDVPLGGIIGYRQITDAYLAQLARVHGGRLATFDRGLAAVHGSLVDLIPTA